MIKIIKRMVTGLLIGAISLAVSPLYSMTSLAATAEIKFSDPSGMVGNDVNVKMSVTTGDGALGGADITLTYDPSVLEFQGGDNANGGAGTIHLIGTMDSDNTTSFQYNLKFKTIQAGNTSISVSGYEIYDKDTQAVSVAHVGSSTVKVTPPATYSTEAALASLEISPGTLDPAFSADVTSYTASVSGDVSKITVSAPAKDKKAKVVISGNSKLKTGQNKVVCKVTAEDGQTVKTYTITVTKSETAETTASESEAETTTGETAPVAVEGLTAQVNGISLQVASSFDETTLPEGFEAATVTYQGSQVMAGKGISKELTLLYLVNGEGAGSFYIYQEDTRELSEFVSLDVSEKSIVILVPEEGLEIPAGYVLNESVEVNGHNVQGWILKGEGEPEYCIFYGMNWNGEKGLYRYDRNEKTIQKFFNDLTDAAIEASPKYIETASKYNELVDSYNFSKYVIIALIVVSLFLFGVIVSLLLRKRGGRGGPRGDYYEEDDREDREFHGQEEMTPVRRRAIQREQETRLQTEDFVEDLTFEDEDGAPDPSGPEPQPQLSKPVVQGKNDEMERRLAALKENRKKPSAPRPQDDEDDFEFLDL